MVFQRQRANPLAAGGSNGIAQGRCQRGLGGFAHPTPKTTGGRNHRFDHGHFVQTHHAVVVEVGLLDATIFDGHLTPENRTQTMHHAALQLGFDVVRIDRIARVNANHHAVDLDFTLVADRHLAHARGVAAITLGFGNAAEHPFGQGTTPIGGLGHGLQDGHIARRLLAQIGQAKCQWVFAR